jgi:peptide/nickel transport system substrate-binding protein
MKGTKLLILVILSVLALGALFGCSPQSSTGAPGAGPAQATQPPEAQPAEAPTLVIAMNIDDLITLDTAIASESTNQFIHANVYDTLVVFNPDDVSKALPRLAESWEAAPGALEYTFHLRKDVKFSSGNPLTANDVVFSWMRSKNMQNWMFGIVDNVEALDDYTVKVTLNTPSADFLALVSHPGWGVNDSKVVQEHGGMATADAYENDTAKEWLDKNSAGSAAYILTDWQPKSEVTMVANPNYWGPQPYYGKVIIKHAEDPTAMLQMLQKGDADIVPYVDIDLVDTAKADPNLAVYVNQSLDTYYLAMTQNCATKVSPETAALLCQKEVRQAVYYSIDFKGLIDAILKGYAVHAPAVLPIGMSEIDPSLAPGRDIQKAKDLLAQAGYPDGITIDFTYNSSPQSDTIAAKLQSDMAEAGITANLKPMEATVYLTQMRAQELPIGFGGWTPDYLDPTLWTDNYACPDTGIAFRMWYDNPAACELSKQIKAEIDPTKRAQEINDLQKIWLDDMNFFNLYQPQRISAMSKDIQGFQYHPARLMDLSLLKK